MDYLEELLTQRFQAVVEIKRGIGKYSVVEVTTPGRPIEKFVVEPGEGGLFKKAESPMKIPLIELFDDSNARFSKNRFIKDFCLYILNRKREANEVFEYCLESAIIKQYRNKERVFFKFNQSVAKDVEIILEFKN